MRAIRHVAERERRLPAGQRTQYRGALSDWDVEDPETSEPRRFRVAYIHSSEEAEQVAAARERALAKAEQDLERVRNGLGGRYYKSVEQVQRRVGQINGPNTHGLISVDVGNTQAGTPTLAWQRDERTIAHAKRTDGIYALATNLPGRLTATKILRLYKQQLQGVFDKLLANTQGGTAPIAALVDACFEYAYDARASDIHIEPLRDQLISASSEVVTKPFSRTPSSDMSGLRSNHARGFPPRPPCRFGAMR